ncbi:MAG: DUF4215 domain-containing protein [Proteobacteria bacterium]|nr:DUF4215 domain-containing protein [Pseudomonadota bacterium]
MRAKVWIWAACFAAVTLIGCGNDSNSSKVPGPSGIGVCGDGSWNEGEACDDGNTTSGDGCSDACSVEPGYECLWGKDCRLIEAAENCGNGVLDDGEACDDGNRESGDGCMLNCMGIENGYECRVAGTPCTKKTPGNSANDYCGDGRVTEGEECDDGNLVALDGCSDLCRIEKGYECPVEGQPCILKAVDGGCGDGVLQSGEECDDGNRVNDDGCSEYCQKEFGWICDDSGKNCHTECGDGIIAGDEICDDDNTEDGDGCKSDCSALEEGFECETLNSMTFCMTESCGDGIVQSGREDCDYGPASADTSTPGYGWDAANNAPLCHMCSHTPYCGDGLTAEGEECDEGVLDENGKPVLDNHGMPKGGEGGYGKCNPDCTWAERCGDGIVQAEEECDDGQNNDGHYGGCNADCTLAPHCGDSIVNDSEGEVCDNGDLNGSTYGECRLDCSGVSGRCGDGIIDAGLEDCDLGNSVDDTGKFKFVDENGVTVGGDGSYGGCNADCTRSSFCGDGVVDAAFGEICDDGFYDPIAMEYKGGSGLYDECRADCTGIASYCGDGIVNGGEDCDFGPALNNGQYSAKGTTCNPDCTEAPYCGDGIVNGDEKCDDGIKKGVGGIDQYNTCKSDCSGIFAECGDGDVNAPFEACDLGAGNNVGGYGKDKCAPGCNLDRYCGDGHVDSGSGEECDDGAGNLNLYGGCSNKCKKMPRCGDGNIDSSYGEECDNGTDNHPSNYGTCNSTTCMWNARCGDGIKNGPETCDEGLIIGGKAVGGDGSYDGCAENCTRTGVAYCGDGMWQSKYEDCDDGNTFAGDGCNNCLVETGWECTGSEGGKSTCAKEKCGNGTLDSGEECDDALHSGMCLACAAKAGYVCKRSTPACPTTGTGNDCKKQNRECIAISDMYGDGVLQPDFEACDDGNKVSGDGCSDGKIDAGYICPDVGKICVAAACGDGIRAYGEECDDGNTADNDGCSSRCQLEAGYRCTVVKNGKTTCETSKGYCGDGIVQTGETCDDGNKTSGDGCSSSCKVELNYKCPTNKGGTCIPASELCGNGTLDTQANYNIWEECDLGSGKNVKGSGCYLCQIEEGYHCDKDGKNCAKGRCNDGFRDAGEQCDDGNARPNDGCSPTCKREVMFDEFIDDEGNISYHPKCGDGITLWMIKGADGKAVEECDDGNLVSGDGCSSQCKIEPGATCTGFGDNPKYVDLDITYYDFRAPQSTTTETAPASFNSSNEASKGGWMSTTLLNQMKGLDSVCGNKTKFTASVSGNTRKGHPDFGCNYSGSTSGCLGMVEEYLDADNRPVLVSNWNSSSTKCKTYTSQTVSQHVTCAGSFHYWYRYVPGLNLQIPSKLRLFQHATDLDMYIFDYANPCKTIGGSTVCAQNANDTNMSSGYFGPLINTGYASTENADGNTKRYGNFTSELHTFFQYKGAATLNFTGDDDVWAFINGKLFVDLGGMRSSSSGSNTIKATTCSFTDKNGNTVSMKCDNDFELYEDGLYELYMFQAERCDSGSNYKLTLDGFLNTGKSVCTPTLSTCGNKKLDSGEECDIASNGSILYSSSVSSLNPKGCTLGCKAQYCGDGIIQSGEECDRGSANDNNGQCTKSCKLAACGDGFVQVGEICDDGLGNVSPTTYSATPKGKCTTECRWAPYCGDGIKDGSEACDLGKGNRDNAYGTGSCTTSCKAGGYCGDGIKNGNEKCDNGSSNSDTAYNGCTTKCVPGPRCGDGIKNGSEQCDNGNGNSDYAYGVGACTTACKNAPYCGDGTINGDGREFCDDGSNNNASNYGPNKCLNTCQTAPYCGDGIVNGDANHPEVCDWANMNKDGEYGGCSKSCTRNAYCGDGKVDPEYEACDLGTANNTGEYGGCKRNCTKAPYCGDGKVNGDASNPEECDKGALNEDGKYNGCSKSCTRNAYCGDGNVDSDAGEACDNGTDASGASLNVGGYGGCKANCQRGPYCGDGKLNGTEEHPEVCDKGEQNADGLYGGCSKSCTLNSYCGDGIVDTEAGEVCDLGKDENGKSLNTGEYGGCAKNCKARSGYCGDGKVQASEQCDNGEANQNGLYGGCQLDCTYGPYCGDGIVNGEEQCDYAIDGMQNSCTNNCTIQVN